MDGGSDHPDGWGVSAGDKDAAIGLNQAMRQLNRHVLTFGDDAEPAGFVMLPSGFNYEDVAKIGGMLAAADILVPGYVPPAVGICNPDGFIYEKQVEGIETILLPDLNVISDWKHLAQGGHAEKTRALSAAILSFCQHLDIQIEPSIAFHELASCESNEVAHKGLELFRAADNAEFAIWRDIALGRRDRVERQIEVKGNSEGQQDLARPLRRWNRNYICLLKAADLELTPISPYERVAGLLSWMRDEFMVAGTVAIFACILFAPNSPPRAGLLKKLKSSDREKAVAGVRNSAWDATHLGEFIDRVNASQENKRRYIFVSHDRGLLQIASSLWRSGAEFREEVVNSVLVEWWPAKEARCISKLIVDMYAAIDDPARKIRQAAAPPDFIRTMIADGEARVRAWEGA